MKVFALVTASVILAATNAAFAPYSQDIFTHRDNTIGIEVNIGTPAQTFLMQVGLADPWLIVASSCCIHCCCDKEFAPWQSSTYKLKEYVSAEGNGFVDYELGSDTVASKVSTGNPPQVNLQVISQLYSTDWEGHTFDGIVPFAYTGNSSTFIDGIFQNQPPLFTIYYQRQCPAPSQSQAKAGTVTYGAVDTANCNAPSYESFDPDVKEPKFLNKVKPTMIHIKSIAVGTTSVALNQSFVQFVTAPTLLMPKKVFHELNKVWNAVIINENSLIVKCDATLAPLTVNFGSNDYKIPYEHLLRNTNGVCSLDITIIDKGDKDFNNAHPDGTFGFWFGLPFLREYCLVTDYPNKRLGFATHTNPEKNECSYASEEPAPCTEPHKDQHCADKPPFGSTTTVTTTTPRATTKAAGQVGVHYAMTSMCFLFALFIR